MRELVAGGLVADGEVDLDVASADGEWVNEAAGDDSAGEAGLRPVEVVLAAGLSVGEDDLLGSAEAAAGNDAHTLRDADVHLGGEAIGHKAGGWEPASGVKEITDGLLNGGQLEALDGSVFIAGDGAVVDEGPAAGLAGGECNSRGDANGAVGGTLAIERLAVFVGDFGDFERGMKAERDDVKIGWRDEADHCGGSEVVRGGIELGVDDVAGNV